MSDQRCAYWTATDDSGLNHDGHLLIRGLMWPLANGDALQVNLCSDHAAVVQELVREELDRQEDRLLDEQARLQEEAAERDRNELLGAAEYSSVPYDQGDPVDG